MASSTQAQPSGLFAEYIGAQFKDVRFSEVPVNSKVQFHFVLAFAIDYDTSTNPSPTDGKFNVFWDSQNLSPDQVSAIKAQHPTNLQVALSLGGDTVHGKPAYFNPTSTDSWVANAVASLTSIIKQYNLDGIDINYEHFNSDPNTFSECIGQLIKKLKEGHVIKFASIAPYPDGTVQSHYMALWNRYGNLIDYVNFQFYAYPRGMTESQFIEHFNEQSGNYKGGRVLASFSSSRDAGGLTPAGGFFSACRSLKRQGKLHGIFVWSADTSKVIANGFTYERQSQELLAGPN